MKVSGSAMTRAEVLTRLFQVMERSTDGRIAADPAQVGEESIRRLGLDSLGVLQFLVAVEDEFGIEWADDVPQATLASFSEMADYIAGSLGHAD
jgi:acyl carrier protein